MLITEVLSVGQRERCTRCGKVIRSNPKRLDGHYFGPDCFRVVLSRQRLRASFPFGDQKVLRVDQESGLEYYATDYAESVCKHVRKCSSCIFNSAPFVKRGISCYLEIAYLRR